MRKFLFVTTAIVSCASVTPAFAQAAAAAVDAPAPGEIIVTAQKRPERLRDIPVAASVLGSAAIQQAHVTDLSDINRVVPSVEIKGTFNGRVPYGIRGISTNANEGAIGLTSGVSIQVDGVPVPADSFAANTISDVAQLEVLKGPQATLGGRTASAGVINFVTNGPTRTAKGSFTAVLTDDGEARVDANVSAPISNTLSFSLSGFAAKTPYPIYNVNRQERSEAVNKGVRGKVKFDSGNFDATVMGHYAIQTSHGGTFTVQYFTPGASVFPFIPSAFNGPGGSPSAFGISQAVAYPGLTLGYGNTQYGSPVDMNSRYEDMDTSLALNYKMGDLTLSSLTSYFKENQFQSQDVFLTNDYFWNDLIHVPAGPPPAFGDFQSATGNVTQTTQEFKIASDPHNAVNFLLGAYYSDMKVDQVGSRIWVANAISKENISTTTTYSAYGRVTAKLSEMFSVTAGLRYNHDKIGWNLNEIFNPAAGQFYQCNPNFSLSAAVNPGPPMGCQFIVSDSSNSLVGDFAVQLHLNKDNMVYASYTRGYKPRAFNTVHDFLSLQSGPILATFPGVTLTPAQIATANAAYAADQTFLKPTKREDIDSFEVGVKSLSMDRHLSINAAAFYTNYHNYQAQIFDNSAVIGLLVLANAGASTKGLEADMAWNSHDTHLSLAAAYIDAKFKNFANGVCYPTQTVAQGCVGGLQNLTGAPLPDSPRFKLNASVEQIIPLSSFNLLLGGNLAYRSSAFLQANQNPQTNQPSFALLDASLGFQTKDEKLSLTFFVNNITNHFYLTDAEDFFSGATGFSPSGPGGNLVVGQPARDSRRYFGARFSAKF